MTQTSRWIVGLLLFGFFTPMSSAESFDIVLAGGTVIDPESGLNEVRHIGIRGTRIVAISESPLSGNSVIDVSDLVVVPGFIDLHQHGQDPVSNRLQALDGVTTALELEVGAYPLANWYDTRRGRASINFGSSVSQLGVRIKMFHLIDAGHIAGHDRELSRGLKAARRVPVAAEKRDMLQELLNAEFDSGGLGIGVPAQYIPGMDEAEYDLLFDLAAQRDAFIFIHAEFSGILAPDNGLRAVKNAIAYAERHRARVHIAHISSTALSDTDEALRAVAAAQARGVRVSTEAYPYRAVGTSIDSAYFDPGWQARYGINYGDITFLKTGKDLTAETFDAAQREGGSVVARSIPEAAMDSAVKDLSVAVASDGLTFRDGTGHPRASGSFSRVLGEFVRDRQLISLPQAIAKMTIVPARILEGSSPQMLRKGRIKIGADADITVFDPATIRPRATYLKPMVPSEGVKYVLVNGEFVVRNGEFLANVFPGRAIVGHGGQP